MKKIIIIGAGMGGLTAGNLLAQKGHQVTIFESHKMPGGYTAGFRRKGFYFESGTLSFESSPMIFGAMKAIGVFDKIPFVRQKSRWISPDFDSSPDNYDEFKNLFRSAYPNDRGALERYFSEVDKMVQAMQPFMSDKKSFLAMAAAGLKMISLNRKYGKVPVSQFTDQFFPKDSKLNRLFSNLGYPDMAAWILGGAIVSIFDDYWTVQASMQHWADVLAEKFTSAGGELRLGTPVDKILTKNGKAVGIACCDTSYDADYVISACDYKKTLLNLLDNPTQIPSERLEKIRNNAVSEGIFTVYLGLNMSGEQLQSIMKMPHIMYFDTLSALDIHDSNDAHYFEKAGIVLYAPSLRNPALAPKGKSSLMLQAVVPYHWMNNWRADEANAYRALKDRAKKILIRKAATIIPGLDEAIEFSDAATPLTYERYTGNTDGATSAWSWNPNNKFYPKFMGTYIDTPIRNLLIGSCWANQIGGVPGAISAAQMCVKRIG
jgi:phytoene dehydrogenase-like protein